MTEHFLPSYLPGSYVYTWIGLNDDGHMGTLTWTDGTSVTFTSFDYMEYYCKCQQFVGFEY